MLSVRAVRILLLAASLAWCGEAAALPRAAVAWPGAGGFVPVQLVCGPYRCFRRPVWRYGNGRGFFPMLRFARPPARRFDYPPFGFGRFGAPRRW